MNSTQIAMTHTSPFPFVLPVVWLMIISAATNGSQSDKLSITPASLKHALERLLVAPEAEIEHTANRLLESSNKLDLSKAFTELAVAEELHIGLLYAMRRIAAHLPSEFQSAVIAALNTNIDPFAKGRLLYLLRDAKTPLDSTLRPLLQDKRTGESIPREASSRGMGPYRVCDIAFNLIHEIRGEDQQLDHYSLPDERDKRIEALAKTLLPHD